LKIAKSKIIAGAEPFFLKGRSKIGVLCIHGFTGSPWDFKELGSFLNRQGYWISAPLLAGHGSSPENLAKTHWQDWLADARQAYQKLAKYCAKVYIVGISLGTNLGMLLAQEKSVSGIISIGGNLSVKPIYRMFIALAPIIKNIKPYFQKKYQEGRLADEVRKKRIGYKVMPLANAKDIAAIIKKSKGALRKINCPILNLVSSTDHAVGKKTIGLLKKYLGRKLSVTEYAQGYHVLLVDPRVKKQVFEEISKFIMTN